MKRAKKRFEQKVRAFAETVDYPPDAFLSLPSVHISGTDEVMVENCSGIVAVEESRIVLDMGEYTVGLFGREMVIESLSKSGLCVSGTVTAVTLDRKAADIC